MTPEIYLSKIDIIPEALVFAEIGILLVGIYCNRIITECKIDCGSVETKVSAVLFDPQTSG